MPLPTVNDVQAVDPVLTNLLVGYMQADTRFAALRAFPAVPVGNDSGTYYSFTKKYWFLDDLEQRAPGTDFPTGNVGLSTSTYTTLQWAKAIPLAEEVRANSQVPMDLETAFVRNLAQRSLIRKERAFATDFMTTGVWGTDDNNSTTDWDDFSAGDPRNDILTAKRTISNATGVDANTIICGYIVHQALLLHPDILDILKYTQTATMATVEGALGAALGVDNYIVSKASFNSANEGQAMTAAAIIDDDALVCYVTPNPGIFEASAGYTFAWAPGGGTGMIRTYYDDARDADMIKHKEQWDQVAVATDVGYFFADVV